LTIHPGYQKIPVNAQGKKPINNPDVAILEINGQLTNILTLATKGELQELRAGQSIQYIGFPMEGLAGKNININSLIATTQSGTITAMSDWWLGDSGQEKNWVIRHDMGATGGASGSPMFNADGHVIGLINAGNIIGQVRQTSDGLKVSRAPSAAMVNFGIRVDLLDEILK
jgi:S1-C subfamily serine protease